MNFRDLVRRVLSPLQSGALEVVLPGGEVWRFGGLSNAGMARIHVQSDNFFRRVVLAGPIGFAESHMAGEWDSPDLAAVIAFFIRNAEDSGAMETRRGARKVLPDILAIYNRILHARRPNSLPKSRENIRDHYDLGNDFFKLWLDETMTYSSGLFEDPGMSLQEAQICKYDALCLKLRLQPHDVVLEIGTGWGGFSMHAAAKYGCRVVTTTISEAQFEEASRRIKAAGLSNRIEVLLRDYRLLDGKYDKIASIEMLEAVGDNYVNGFFNCCARLLKPQGLLGLQAILCPDQQYPILKKGVDFIQKHIFPGSLLMSMGRILEATGRTHALNLFEYRDMAADYAKTLHLWLENFDRALPEVKALGYDETFIRKWRYYLSYCEAAFATRFITVAQFVFTNPCNTFLNRGTAVDGWEIAR